MKQYPKIDLHRHLEGAIRLSTVLEISQQHQLSLPAATEEELRPFVWITEPTSDIVRLFPKFDLLRQIFLTYDICRRVTMECIDDAVAQGLDYLELRFSPLFMAELHHLDPLSVTAAVCEGWREAARVHAFPSGLLVILSRTYGPEACSAEMDCALQYKDQGILGVDLAGDESRQPAGQFQSLFDRARDAGLKITAHAGEFSGADSVRQTILSLCPDRLGHAVHAVDDPLVLDMILERGIGVECCPTSNVLTTAVRVMKEHPLPIFLRHGILATINTDDPALMGDLTLEDEYSHARIEMGCSEEEVAMARQNARKVAFSNPEL